MTHPPHVAFAIHEVLRTAAADPFDRRAFLAALAAMEAATGEPLPHSVEYLEQLNEEQMSGYVTGTIMAVTEWAPGSMN